jgi:hypothetical protein
LRSGLPLGGPLRHEDAVQAVAFDPDGKSVWTGGRDQTLVHWRVPAGPVVGLPEGSPERLRCWVEALAGLELDDDGLFRPLDTDALRQRRERLNQIGGPPTS